MKLLKQILKYESYLVTERRSRDVFCVRPSIVISILLYLLYLVSPLNLFLHGDFTVSAIGLFIDILLLCIVSLYFYSDLGGMKVGKVRWEDFFKQTEYNKESSISEGDRSIEEFTDISSTVDSISASDVGESNFRIPSFSDSNSSCNNNGVRDDVKIECTEEFVEEDGEGDRL